MPDRVYSRRDIATFAVGMFIATVLTVWGVQYALIHFVLATDDPLYKAGGLKRDQIVKERAGRSREDSN